MTPIATGSSKMKRLAFNQHRNRQEVSFSELFEWELQQLQYIDQYAPDRRNIVLLAYLLNMTDKGIAQLLKLTRSTVQYRRTSTLEQLKTIMEGFEYGHFGVSRHLTNPRSRPAGPISSNLPQFEASYHPSQAHRQAMGLCRLVTARSRTLTTE